MSISKPTPPQAIMLRELSNAGAFAFAYQNRHNKITRAFGSQLASSPDQNYKPITASTLGALVLRGWVEQIPGHKYRLSRLGLDILNTLGEDDFNCDRPEYTADEIVEILRNRYTAPEWVFFDELRFGTAYGKDSEQRIDAWAMNTWPSKDLLKIAFEIKIYRSDFLKEIKDPSKRKPALSVSNQFYFIGPRNIIKKEEVPEDCGLMEISEGIIKTTKIAFPRKIEAPTWRFLASIARRAQNNGK